MATDRAVDRYTQFVMKTSKFCNLRCRYCYEMADLAKRDAMSREDLRRIYANIREHYEAADRADGCRTEVRFIWHGGEPLLMAPQFYWDTFADQEEIFGDVLSTSNVVQTNLTVLDDERLRLLRDGFDSVGVSLDVFGGLRVSLNGRDQQRRVLRNMDRLRKEGVRFGCITVLTRQNLGRVQEICRFFARAGVQFRVLPLFEGAYEGQHGGYELTTSDILEALKSMIDFWLQSDGALRITPLDEYVQNVVHRLTEGAQPRYYNKRVWNPALLVNTNGDCYNSGDPYGDPEWTVGNLITTPLSQILGGERMERSFRAAEERLALNCTRCPYFGSCSGYPIVEEDNNARELSASGVRICHVERQLHEHIETRLRGAGLPGRALPMLPVLPVLNRPAEPMAPAL